MIETFVRRPATTIVFILFFVLLGGVSYFNLNVEQNPRIEFPLVVVNVTYPGASPSEVETQIIKKVEDAVAEISEIKSIKSRAYENFGYTLVEFYLSADANVKSAEVKDKVDGIINELPDGIDKPIVERIDPFAKSVIEIALTSEKHSPKELFEYADKKLKNQFSKITGVGSVDVFGGEEREIRVELDPVAMKSRYISINEVVNSLKSQNLNIPGGNIDRAKNSISVRYLGEFTTIEQIRNFRLKASDGNQFTLGEVAKVYDGSKKVESLSRFNGEAVVALSVKKISDGNEVKVASGVRGLLPEISKSLPEGMKLSVASDTSTTIVSETQGTLVSIGIGILLTVLILFLFSGNVRMTIIAAVVIPSSIISAILLMDFSNFTINFITLLAMATSLGTLIANAIVIIESVLVHLEMGKDPKQAAIDGTRDVIIPVLASCGTNLVVFTPIAFMGGIVGQFMLQFGLTVVYATIFSLIASFSLTPMMCGALLKPIDKNQSKESNKENIFVRATNTTVAFILKEYNRLFDVMFRFPKIWSLGIVASLIWAFSLASYIGNEFIPVSDVDRIQIDLTLPQGSTIWETSKVTKEVESLLVGLPEVENTLSVLGDNGTQNARIIVSLLPKDQRQKSDAQLIEELTPAVAKIPNIEAEFKRGDGGGGGNADVSLNVQGIDYNELIKHSEAIKNLMLESGYFRSVSSSYKTPKEELQFIPDMKKLEQYGVNGALLGTSLRASIFGDESNIFKDQGEEYDIRVELGENYKSTSESLEKINILTNFGLVSLSELGEFKRTTAAPTIWRRDRSRIIQLNGYLSKSTAGVVEAELTQEIESLNLPDGYSFQFVGNSESQAESGREIGKAFGLAIILTFMLLAAILNSFVHPLSISSSILTSFGGVFFLLFMMESSINIASMLGIVMLVGLVVNNAILIIDQTEVNIREGETDIKKALWNGISDKFRAVLMTSIAIIAGALPQTWSPDLAKASMGLVIIGGTFASIIYTFLFTPIVYWYMERMRRWVGASSSGKKND